MTKLTVKAVDKILKDVFYKDGENHDNAIKVEGVVHGFGFHPDRLKTHEAEIRELLAELPDPFKKGSGDGWSFLEAAVDKHGNLWGDHATMEALFALGIATGIVRWMLPRELWGSFPGGMPYVQVDLTKH